jgi:hypothetical protein
MSEKNLRTCLNRLAKWRSVFAGWQLGTRPLTDPECQAVRDHREVTILLRCEVNALAGLLLRKGLLKEGEWAEQLIEEADHLEAAYEAKFPGFKASDTGMECDLAQVRETTRHWRP